jgi:hypothetical protein
MVLTRQERERLVVDLYYNQTDNKTFMYREEHTFIQSEFDATTEGNDRDLQFCNG